MTRDNNSLQVPTFSRSTSSPSTADATTTKEAKATKATKKGGFLLWGSSTEVSNDPSPNSTSIMPSRKGLFVGTDGNTAESNNQAPSSKIPSRNTSDLSTSTLPTGGVSFTTVTDEHEFSHALQARQLRKKLATLGAHEGAEEDPQVTSRDSSKGDGVTVN